MIDAVRGYLEMLRAPPATAREALRALAKALDQLSSVYHDTMAVDVEDSPDPPQQATYDEMRALVARAFPDFGFYAVTRPRDVPPSEGLLADAMSQFRRSYGDHWGRHLHDLRGYVHALQFEGTERLEPILG